MELLLEIILIYGLAIIVLLLFSRLKVHVIVGFLITGMIAGPFGLGIVADTHEVEELAEIGILLLLFTIGIELSLKKLLQVKKLVLIGGGLQVLLTILVTFGVATYFERSFAEALFIGFLFSLSSTAIVLKILQDQGYIDSLYGKTALGILIFQDIVIVPMMLVTPFLAQTDELDTDSLLQNLLIGVAFVVAILLVTRFVMPYIFHLIAKSRSRELFLLFVVVVCFSVAFMTYEIGLSLSLGAFMAGLIISESEYSHNALSNILPLRDLFTSLFFVSVGMLLDLDFLLENISLALLVTIGVIILKFLVLLLVGAVLRLTMRTIFLSAFALWQVGEFAFVLSITGIENDLIAPFDYQLFLSVSILTMIVTPFVLMRSPKWVDKLVTIQPLRFLARKIESKSYRAMDEAVAKRFRDHLIIIGFGLNGRNVAKAAKMANIPYVIIESNPSTVMQEKKNGENIFFGDASQEEILNHASIKNARICVIAISDPLASERIVVNAKLINPKLFIIVRTRYITEISILQNLGADQVIPEEFETSIEIFSRVLQKYLVPKGEIDSYVQKVRAESYAMLRSLSADTLTSIKLNLSNMEVIKAEIAPDHPYLNKTLAEVGFRRKYQATVIAIIRDDETIENPDAEVPLNKNDILILLGKPQALNKAREALIKSKIAE